MGGSRSKAGQLIARGWLLNKPNSRSMQLSVFLFGICNHHLPGQVPQPTCSSKSKWVGEPDYHPPCWWTQQQNNMNGELFAQKKFTKGLTSQESFIALSQLLELILNEFIIMEDLTGQGSFIALPTGGKVNLFPPPLSSISCQDSHGIHLNY